MTTTDTQRDIPALIDCETAARALYDFLDGRLPHATMQAVQAHVDTCTTCASHYRFARRVLDLIPAAVPLAGESHALRLKIVESLKAEGYIERAAG